ncbi:MAG: DUF2213 domain-containing protein [Pseudomonadota bacterium]
MTLNDALQLTDEGYLEVNARVARTGIQIYHPSELGLVGDGPVRVYRDADEVFAKDSLNTFSGLPITIGHPAQMVDAASHSDLSKGHTGQEVLRDGEHLKIGLKITDAKAVDLVRVQKVRDLSVGYTSIIDATPGTTPDGEPYDARQTQIRANHIAIVPQGRAGTARIGDSRWGASPLPLSGLNPHNPAEKEPAMADQKLQTVVFSDEAYAVNDQGMALHKAMKASLDEAMAEAKEMGDRIAELEAKDTAATEKIADLNKQVTDAKVTPKMLADAAKSRQATIDAAKKMGVEEDMDDMDEEDMKKAAVAKKMGDKAKDFTSAQIATAFDTLAALVVSKDSLAGGLETPQPAKVGDVQVQYEKNLADAWKKPLGHTKKETV